MAKGDLPVMTSEEEFYVPIMAYPNVGEIFLGKAYRNAMDRRTERLHNQSLFESFSFPDNKASDRNRKRVFPILARFDWYSDLHKAQDYWRGYTIKVIDSGHWTLGFCRTSLQRYISEKISENAKKN